MKATVITWFLKDWETDQESAMIGHICTYNKRGLARDSTPDRTLKIQGFTSQAKITIKVQVDFC